MIQAMKKRSLAFLLLCGCHTVLESRTPAVNFEIRKDGAVYLGDRNIVEAGSQNYAALNEIFSRRRQDPRFSRVGKAARYATYALKLNVASGTPFEHVARIMEQAHYEGGVLAVSVRSGQLEERVELPVTSRINPWLVIEHHGYATYLCARGNPRFHRLRAFPAEEEDRHLKLPLGTAVLVTTDRKDIGKMRFPDIETARHQEEIYEDLQTDIASLLLNVRDKFGSVNYCPGVPVEYVLLAHRAMKNAGARPVDVYLVGAGCPNRRPHIIPSDEFPNRKPPWNKDE